MHKNMRNTNAYLFRGERVLWEDNIAVYTSFNVVAVNLCLLALPLIKLLSFCGGEGNGSPLQYSCLENPMDGGAW